VKPLDLFPVLHGKGLLLDFLGELLDGIHHRRSLQYPGLALGRGAVRHEGADGLASRIEALRLDALLPETHGLGSPPVPLAGGLAAVRTGGPPALAPRERAGFPLRSPLRTLRG
jgi:hypothetical protein